MPRIKLKTKNLVLASVFIVFALLLSGCSAVGFNNPAALQVTSKPEASIFLDGKHLGKTPFFSDQLKKGEYTLKVTVSEANYVDKINLSEGTLTVVNRELNSNFLAQSGENLSLISGEKGLFIISNPTEADVIVDGSYAGETPFLTREINHGDHVIQLVKEGYIEREFAIKTSSKFQVLADVTLASKIAKGDGIASKEPQQIETERVLVSDTPQGFLRVRDEASLSSAELGRVNDGEEFEIIQEEEDWFQISFQGKTGWISAAYAQKIE